ncbi:hypothetical protein [uncultured Psychroserpens sp.]|uniref:hypothetical protein n=1 Tax=uncultured Psychroserpens sp. TaxID=255436 RepID=UPI0026123F83|nr:hypothetical protein [uncultured Psychroserpens sp.]
MGWKSSLIIIENKENFADESAILKAIGKSEYEFDRESTLDECIYPNDKSINIGYFNGNIIICDDYQLTTNSLERADELILTKEEQKLVDLFPTSEIVTVACHSAVNYHGYSLIESGVKKRLKIITSDTPRIEFGERIEEEIKIYQKSYSKDNQNFWKDDYDPEEDLTEDQLMEDFTFGVAKRRLGVLLDHSDGDELMEQIIFKKFKNPNQTSEVTESIKVEKKAKWIKYGIIILILIIWQILKRTVFKN